MNAANVHPRKQADGSSRPYGRGLSVLVVGKGAWRRPKNDTSVRMVARLFCTRSLMKKKKKYLSPQLKEYTIKIGTILVQESTQATIPDAGWGGSEKRRQIIFDNQEDENQLNNSIW